MHSLAVLLLLSLFRIVVLSSDNFSLRFIADRILKLSKIAVPCIGAGLILANFSFLIYFNETRESLKAVGNGDFNILPRIGALFVISKNPQCWESICHFYVRDSYSEIIYNLISPLSLCFVILAFLITANKAKNIAILIVTTVCAFIIQGFIATGYANYPWYHLTYFPLLLSMLLYLEMDDFSKVRKLAFYVAIVAAIVGNLSTTYYLLKTDYGFRHDVSDLIKDSPKNTVCIDEIISNQKPDAYIFSVISVFTGNNNSFVDVDFLRQRYFSSRQEMFNQSGYLSLPAIEVLSQKKNLKLLFSIDEVSVKYNSDGYNYQKPINFVKSGFEKYWQENFPERKMVSEIKKLESCSRINNYVLQINSN